MVSLQLPAAVATSSTACALCCHHFGALRINCAPVALSAAVLTAALLLITSHGCLTEHRLAARGWPDTPSRAGLPPSAQSASKGGWDCDAVRASSCLPRLLHFLAGAPKGPLRASRTCPLRFAPRRCRKASMQMQYYEHKICKIPSCDTRREVPWNRARPKLRSWAKQHTSRPASPAANSSAVHRPTRRGAHSSSGLQLATTAHNISSSSQSLGELRPAEERQPTGKQPHACRVNYPGRVLRDPPARAS